MIIVLEGERTVGLGAAAERQIAPGDEYEVALEEPAVDVATAIHRRLVPLVRPDGEHGRRAGVELGDRRRGEEHVGVEGVDGLLRLQVDGEDAPARAFVLGGRDDGLNSRGEVIVGDDSGGWREHGCKSQRKTGECVAAGHGRSF